MLCFSYVIPLVTDIDVFDITLILLVMSFNPKMNWDAKLKLDMSALMQLYNLKVAKMGHRMQQGILLVKTVVCKQRENYLSWSLFQPHHDHNDVHIGLYQAITYTNEVNQSLICSNLNLKCFDSPIISLQVIMLKKNLPATFPKWVPVNPNLYSCSVYGECVTQIGLSESTLCVIMLWLSLN